MGIAAILLQIAIADLLQQHAVAATLQAMQPLLQCAMYCCNSVLLQYCRNAAIAAMPHAHCINPQCQKRIAAILQQWPVAAILQQCPSSLHSAHSPTYHIGEGERKGEDGEARDTFPRGLRRPCEGVSSNLALPASGAALCRAMRTDSQRMAALGIAGCTEAKGEYPFPTLWPSSPCVTLRDRLVVGSAV